MYVTVDIKSHPNYPSTKPLRQELESLDGIHSVGNTSYSLPFKNPLGERIYEHPVSGIPTHVRYTSYGEDFFKSLGVNVIAGQIPEHLNDTGVNNQIARAEYLVINESFAKLIGFKTPSDALERCIYPLSKGTRDKCQLIKAVVSDFHFSARKTPIEPTAFQPVIGYVNRMIIQFDNNADTQSLLPIIQELWNKHFPERVFEYEFVSDLINDQFKGLQGMGAMFLIVSGITLCLAVSGLLAMAKFSVNKRKREIAIRRVVGAATLDIVSLMITQLGKPIVFGTIIGMPAGWYASQLWLNNHTIRIEIEPVYAVIFTVSIITVFLITVTAEILRAARIHPAHTLTNE
jgi:putative ABC transport system permease protein